MKNKLKLKLKNLKRALELFLEAGPAKVFNGMWKHATEDYYGCCFYDEDNDALGFSGLKKETICGKPGFYFDDGTLISIIEPFVCFTKEQTEMFNKDGYVGKAPSGFNLAVINLEERIEQLTIHLGNQDERKRTNNLPNSRTLRNK